MKQKDLEQKVIEIYELVNLSVITPNQARRLFMDLIHEHVAEVIGEDDFDDHTGGSAMNKNMLRAEQRKRAGL